MKKKGEDKEIKRSSPKELANSSNNNILKNKNLN